MRALSPIGAMNPQTLHFAQGPHARISVWTGLYRGRLVAIRPHSCGFKISFKVFLSVSSMLPKPAPSWSCPRPGRCPRPPTCSGSGQIPRRTRGPRICARPARSLVNFRPALGEPVPAAAYSCGFRMSFMAFFSVSSVLPYPAPCVPLSEVRLDTTPDGWFWF